MRYEDLADQPCSITRPLVILGDRWTLLLLKSAFSGVRRFSDFQNELGISKSRLADRLGRLVQHEILVKERVNDAGFEEYRLTAKGHDLYPILIAIKDWGDTYMAPAGPPVIYRHRDCSGQAHAPAVCDECGSHVTARDITPELGPGVQPAPL